MNTKRFLLFFTTLLFSGLCFAQDEQTDSLLTLLKNTEEDTVKVNILNELAAGYFDTSPENAIKYATEAKTLAEDAGYAEGLAYALKNIGIAYYMQADYVQTLTYWNQSLTQFEEANDKKGIANILSNLGAVYYNQSDDAKALDYYLRALKYAEENNDTLRIVTLLNNIGAVYFRKTATWDKALSSYLKALPLAEAISYDDIGTITVNIGEIYLGRGEDSLALQYFERSAKVYENSKNLPYPLNDIAKVYEKRKEYNTALQYHQQALDIATRLSARLEMSQSYQGLATVYAQMNDIPKALQAYKDAELIAQQIGENYELEKIYRGLSKVYAANNDYANAYKYQSLLSTVKDSLYNAEADKRLASILLNFEIQKKQAEIDLLTRDKKLKELDLKTQATVRNSLIVVLTLVITIAFILFRNYRIKDKTNTVLDAQKKELERTLAELKTTQAQLIQSEKMASLGELTAGIAHEIQNPLNFVNNFSEVNTELIEELKHYKSKDGAENNDEEYELLDTIFQNNEKIAIHGKRADAIVKGMLQHSRKNTGQKEPTDINALCDEYLRLSFLGLRGKEKNANIKFNTDFDRTIGRIKVVPQDIGRVLLNLFNNAFYAVGHPGTAQGENYHPLVTVTTKKISPGQGAGPQVEITVKDNGNGIPKNIVDKIFQPFFTTKPTKEGTGLGLSLSYDVIKSHGGEIEVKTEEGEGCEFIITLPVT